MQALPQAATLSVVVLGLLALVVARLPAFRKDFRRSISLIVGAVSILTIMLSLNVMLTALSLQEAAAVEQAGVLNGLLLAGFVLLLVSALAFFFSLGVFIWTMVPPDHGSRRFPVGDPTAPPSPPRDPYTP